MKSCNSNKKEYRKKYVYVNFAESSMDYIYRTDLDCKVGNIVEAPTLNYVIMNNAIVTKVVNLSDNQLPIDKSKILKITKLISEKDENGIFDKIGYMTRRIDKTLIREWEFDYEDDWVKVFKSTFGGEISYEQDGVLEVSIGDFKNDDYFFHYTITSQKYFTLKLQYVETITSQLFHEIITEDDFVTMLDKLP